MIWLSAFLLISLTWLGYFVLFTGLGLLIGRVLKLKATGFFDALLLFWIGWAVHIFILQYYHLFFPVNIGALIFLSTLSGTGFIIYGHALRPIFQKNIFSGYIICFLLLLVMVADSAMLPPSAYDNGLYHLASIRWNSEYPIIFGLGNLHGRLAFNSSYFLYAALTESMFWKGQAHHVTNGLLILVTYAMTLTGLRELFSRYKFRSAGAVFTVLLFFVVWFTGHISSPTPDLPIVLIAMLLLLLLFKLYESDLSELNLPLYGSTIILLVIVGLTIKLSFAVFGLGIVTMMLARVRNTEYVKPAWTTLMISASLGLGAWVFRGIILSGYPAYPLAKFGLPVDWRVPMASVVNNQNWTLAWARSPQISHWNEVLGSWEWVGPWYASMMSSPLLKTTCSLTIIGLGVLYYVMKRSDPKERIFGPLWCVLPCLAGLAYWFVSAPDIRFATFIFWGIGIVVAAVAVFHLKHFQKTILVMMIVSSVCLMKASTLDSFVHGTLTGIARNMSSVELTRKTLDKSLFNRRGLISAPREKMTIFVTDSGLELFVPQKGDQVWGAQLPNTIYPHKGLTLRKEGTLRHGFKMEPFNDTDASVGMHETWIQEKWID